MGCPDWPKCFGSYIPPSSSESLPDNYQDIFRSKRLQKNERLAGIFASLGYQGLAERITDDPLVLEEQEFSYTKAWIEYINRLVGVLIGFLVFANMLYSIGYWRRHRGVTVAGFAIFILTGFQGWVGSLVVSTNLLHGFITFHMLLALFILGLLIWMNIQVRSLQIYKNSRLFWVCLVSLVLFMPQIILGTDVRAIIDELLITEGNRAQWTPYLEKGIFYFHRSYSWIVLVSSITIFYMVRKYDFKSVKPYANQLVVLVIVGMLAGAGMVWFDFPFWMQPLHLIVATGIFSILLFLTLRVRYQQ